MMTDNVINVGVRHAGIFYNSYLIKARKNVLIDTVPKECANELIKNISQHIDINDLHSIIINHTESDRCGALFELLSHNSSIEIIASLAGLNNLEQQLNIDFNKTLAKSNMIYKIDDDISLKFIITHNINWPDSMMVYNIENKILFSCDAFSNELSTKEDYFQKKLSPMSVYINSAMIQLNNIEISKIYPGSGEEITDISIINDYIKWCDIKENFNKITILYLSNSGNTKLLADYAKEKIKDSVLINIDTTSNNEIYESIYSSKGVIFATPTEYRNIPKRMSEILCGINQYRLSDTQFAAFGSYGWSGEATNLVYSMLKARHFNTFKSPFRIMFKPTNEDFVEFSKYLEDFINQLDWKWDIFIMPKFFVPKENIHNNEIVINNDDVAHIKRVLRANIGDELILCDGQGVNYQTEIFQIFDKQILLKVISSIKADTESNIEVTIFQGLPKASKMDYIIQKTTELGVVNIVPCKMARSVSKIENAKDAKKKCERWQKISEEAAKQSGRGIIPQIYEPVDFKVAVKMMKDYDLAFAPYECEEENKLKNVLCSKESVKTIAFMIGPEGGFDLEETEILKTNSIPTVTLGKRILRTETAGEAVLAMVMYELGDINI